MAANQMRSLSQLPTPLLSLVMLAVGVVLTFVLPVGSMMGRAFLALVAGLTLILLVGFLVPQVARKVRRSSLLVHTGASFFFGLISIFFLNLSVIPWIATWLILCLAWTFLPAPSFHQKLEENFGDLFT